MGEEKQRIPPNQRVTSKFPVLHLGAIPKFDPKTWDFVMEGLVENPLRLTYEEFLKFPKMVSVSDFHCVTGWSRLDSRWEGVTFKTISDMVKPLKEAKYVTIVAEIYYNTHADNYRRVCNMEKINFRLRGIILLVVGFIILVIGLSLYFKLNAGTGFLSAVLGFSIPFFFIGGLLLRAHLRVKKGQPPFSW